MKKIIFAVILFFSVHSLASSQTITGNGNTSVIGDNNDIANTHNITKSEKIFYNSKDAFNDLKDKKYNKVIFEGEEYEKLPVVIGNSNSTSVYGQYNISSDSKTSTDKKLLLITATNFESIQLHKAAERNNFKPEMKVYNDQIVYKLGNKNGVEIYHMQPFMMGMLEPGSTPLILMSVFNNLKPDYIIATGIAFGRQNKGQELGDILVSRQLVNYETRKETNGDIIFRGDKVTSPLSGRINSAIHSWSGAKVHTGLVLSGNVLVNSKEFLNFLLKKEPEYTGGDMESYGVYSVSSMMGSKWIMIKGISDWGDGTKNDNYHQIALENVGNFIFHAINQGVFLNE
jgi:nucleoside phosphorylase